MSRGYEFLRIKCAHCSTELIRIAESKANDRVYCPNCFAFGDYESVVEQGSGLIGGHPHR
jgi:phage FluMu protein Com